LNPATSTGERLGNVLVITLASALTLPLIATLVMGGGYYATPTADRELHELHKLLAPGAGGGVALGLLGTSLMVAMLSYSVRKRFPNLHMLGPMPVWLRFHVVCGITGPLFILLHVGLKMPEGLIAVGFWCMVLVALSGVFGRYVYGFLPRVADGRAIAWGEAMAALADMRAQLVAATPGAGSAAIGEAVALARDLDVSAVRMVDLFRLDREIQHRRTRIRALIATSNLAPDRRSSVTEALDEQLKLKRSVEAANVASRMFRYWHLFHRPLAAAMYVIVALHVTFAILFGGSLQHLAALWGG
jgi:hypothetical protein